MEILRKKNDDKIALIKIVNEYCVVQQNGRNMIKFLQRQEKRSLWKQTMHFGWRGCRKNANAHKMLQTNSLSFDNLGFLVACGGSTKPGIVQQMDQLDLETELKNNPKELENNR